MNEKHNRPDRIPETKAKAEETALRCPHCAGSARPGAQFCGNCSEPLEHRPEETAELTPLKQEEAPAAAQEPTGAETENLPSMPPAECHCPDEPLKDAKYCHRCGGRIERGPKLRLVCESRGQCIGTHEIGRETHIGAGDKNDLVIENDRYISRRHARVHDVDGTLVLEDLASRNGTLLRLRRPVALQVGDEFFVGETLIRLEEHKDNPPERI